MICGNTSDVIYHPLPKHFVSAHGASHHAWAPRPPPPKSGAGMILEYKVTLLVPKLLSESYIFSLIFVINFR